jgi:hypothetical protein
MNKIIVAFLLMVTFASVLCFGLDYWSMDVVVDNYGKKSTQKVYFFKDLQALEEATGFPQRAENNRFNWSKPLSGKSQYDYEIYSVMRRDGFVTAFVLTSSGTSINNRSYWIYCIYLLWNDVEYYDLITCYDRPVRF